MQYAPSSESLLPPALEESYSIGDVAARLGVAPETVRSWGRRYGLTASARTEGGHRRYSPDDLDTFMRMQELIAGGSTPGEAARAAAAETRPRSTTRARVSLQGRRPRSRPAGGPGGRVLAVPGGSPQARGLARAASRLDFQTCTDLIGELLVTSGVTETWSTVIVPVLQAAGLRWMQTGSGVDIEHVLSEAVIESLRGYKAFLPKPVNGRPILLAGAPTDVHTVPLHVLSAALCELRVPSLLLGARVPEEALASAARRTGAAGIFVWRQLEVDRGNAVTMIRPDVRAAVRIVIGGPGWRGVPLPPGVRYAHSLAEAVELLSHRVR